jgi:hypothetical protein
MSVILENDQHYSEIVSFEDAKISPFVKGHLATILDATQVRIHCRESSNTLAKIAKYMRYRKGQSESNAYELQLEDKEFLSELVVEEFNELCVAADYFKMDRFFFIIYYKMVDIPPFLVRIFQEKTRLIENQAINQVIKTGEELKLARKLNLSRKGKVVPWVLISCGTATTLLAAGTVLFYSIRNRNRW